MSIDDIFYDQVMLMYQLLRSRSDFNQLTETEVIAKIYTTIRTVNPHLLSKYKKDVETIKQHIKLIIDSFEEILISDLED